MSAPTTPLAVEIAGDRIVFAPGEKVDGVVRWALENSPPSLEVRLFWFTRGKGTQDVEVIDKVAIDSPAMAGHRPFSFTLPAGPYSFSGTLISLTWAIEVVAKKTDPARIEFVMSPFGREIDLTASPGASA